MTLSEHPSLPFQSVELLFGRTTARVEIPDSAELEIIRKPTMPVLPDARAAVLDAIGRGRASTESLFTLAQTARSACIAICDITRPVPNHLFLRPMIETMLRAGIQRHAITVLVATGLHRPNEGEELRELIGDDWVLENVKVLNHFATNDADHVDLGFTPTRQVPVKIDRRFVEADLRIATGLVEPHFMAGYSGGRKVVAPGLAHADTIRTFHNHAFMSNPAAVNCNLAGNPLHEEQLEIIRMIGGAYAINTVIDEDRQLSLINFGEIVSSHAHAVDFVQDYCRASVPEPFDVVITSGAGYPLDQTYYQTVKGMVGAIDVLKPGGDLFIVSECAEGLGSAEYREAQEQLVRLGDDAFLNSLQPKTRADIDQWQSQMQTRATSRANVHLLSKLSPENRSATAVNVYDNQKSFEQAIAAAATSRKRIGVIPEGPYVIPYIANQSA